MQDLKVTLVQTELAWEDVKTNLNNFDRLIGMIEGETDLIILPEMFSTGFSMNAKDIAEPMDGSAVEWMADRAAREHAVITGSLIIEEDGKFYNRLVWMNPDGEYETYDKRHLFSLTDEPEVFTAGQNRLVVNLHGFKICPLICYDLRFPVWARNDSDIDFLIYVANWPAARSYPWKSLLVARAIENQCFVAGVNRVGEDAKGILYSGDTSLIDPLGEVLFAISNVENVSTFNLSREFIERVRNRYPFLHDRDNFTITD